MKYYIALAFMVCLNIAIICIGYSTNQSESVPMADSKDLVSGSSQQSDVVEITPMPTPTPEPTLAPEERKYRKAINDFRAEKYKTAANGFKSLGNYKDSEKLYKRARYRLAVRYYKEEKYEKAKKIFTDLSGYQKSTKYVNRCIQHIFQRSIVTIYGWNDTTPWEGDGVEMTLSWEELAGADGYEVYEGEDEGGWYYDTYDTGDDNWFSTEFSDVIALYAKVRAYKYIAGSKYYTAWSDIATWESDW
mgnify:CR=1 FL=1